VRNTRGILASPAGGGAARRRPGTEKCFEPWPGRLLALASLTALPAAERGPAGRAAGAK
jgi:hypothetical protein